MKVDAEWRSGGAPPRLGCRHGPIAADPAVTDPLQPYGPLLGSSIRLVTWNVWGRYGPWERRQDVLASVLADVAPDVVVLQEAWSAGERDQAAELGARLGLAHHRFDGDREEDGARSGIAVISRWPIGGTELRALTGTHGRPGTVLRTDVDGPRGLIRVFGVILDWPPHYSHVRQQQVQELAEYVRGFGRAELGVVCGDFNAPADADEIRMLTGRAAGCRVAWQDAWELAGDGGPGHTWSHRNPWAAPLLQRDARIDYVFSVAIGPGGRGHPVAARLLGATAGAGIVASDHYGVLAELRY